MGVKPLPAFTLRPPHQIFSCNYLLPGCLDELFWQWPYPSSHTCTSWFFFTHDYSFPFKQPNTSTSSTKVAQWLCHSVGGHDLVGSNLWRKGHIWWEQDERIPMYFWACLRNPGHKLFQIPLAPLISHVKLNQLFYYLAVYSSVSNEGKCLLAAFNQCAFNFIVIHFSNANRWN